MKRSKKLMLVGAMVAVVAALSIGSAVMAANNGNGNHGEECYEDCQGSMSGNRWQAGTAVDDEMLNGNGLCERIQSQTQNCIQSQEQCGEQCLTQDQTRARDRLQDQSCDQSCDQTCDQTGSGNQYGGSNGRHGSD